MKIAIIGSGISGLTAAWHLQHVSEVTLFEANETLGGHTHTVDVELEGQSYAIDTGFIVYNEQNYPRFIEFLEDLGVETQPTSMSFSVENVKTGLVYNGESLRGLLANPWNLASPTFYRLLADILRFNRVAPAKLEEVDSEETVGQFLKRLRFSNAFAENYLLPMGAAIWSCPMAQFAEFPIRFIIEFYVNHGLLKLTDRPIWRVLKGGSRSYIQAMQKRMHCAVELATPVHSIERQETGVMVKTAHSTGLFDEVVIATHSDTALKMHANPTTVEQQVLSAFPYSQNRVVLHTDRHALPKPKAAWASWNYRLGNSNARPTLTYYMNLLQGIESPHDFCVTLNDEHIDEKCILGEFQYSHPVFTTQRDAMQARHSELIRHDRISYCGAYWGNGFHEDGVVSALKVVEQFGNGQD